MDESILYLVRVWLAETGFRAAVRAVDSDRVETFTAAEELARYFGSLPLPCPSSLPMDQDQGEGP